MPLRVIQNLSLADQVFAQLSHEILSGRCQAGAQLPSERRLVETFKVNRHVVREALKRLEQIGLVHVAQGGGTAVLDFKMSAGLDLLALMAEHAEANEPAMKYWLAVHEMRAAIAADVARLCAIRGRKDIKQKISEIARKMADVADGPELFRLEFRFWDSVIEGAGNIAYRLAYNSLVRAVLSPAAAELAQQWSIREIKKGGYRLPIANAIASGDAKTAELKARESMAELVELLIKHVAVVEKQQSEAVSATRTQRRAAARKPRKR